MHVVPAVPTAGWNGCVSRNEPRLTPKLRSPGRAIAAVKTLAVPYKWNMGTIIPCANQIRLAILEWSPKTRELNEVTLTRGH